MNYTQHPLKLAIPRLSSEEINSLIFCEGVVLLTDIEAMTAISLEWLRDFPRINERYLPALSMAGWHKEAINTRKNSAHEAHAMRLKLRNK